MCVLSGRLFFLPPRPPPTGPRPTRLGETTPIVSFCSSSLLLTLIACNSQSGRPAPPKGAQRHAKYWWVCACADLCVCACRPWRPSRQSGATQDLLAPLRHCPLGVVAVVVAAVVVRKHRPTQR